MTKIEIINNLSKQEIITTLKKSFSLQEFFSIIFNKKTKSMNYTLKALKERLKEYDLDLKRDFPHIGKTSPIWKISSENFKK